MGHLGGEFPLDRKGAPGRGILLTLAVFATYGSDIARRTHLGRLQIGKDITLPDLLLPAIVVTLNRRLDTELAGYREDRGHAQAQAQSDNAPHGIGMLVRPDEHIPVVELGIGRQTVGLPMRHKAFQHKRGVLLAG